MGFTALVALAIVVAAAVLSALLIVGRVIEVVARVWAVNLALAVLALATILLPSRMTDIIAMSVGAALVAWILVVFAHGPERA
jgi:hypothetical protein